MEGGRRNGAAINNPSRHAPPTGAIRAAACLPLSTAVRPCIDSRCSPLAPHNSMTSIHPSIQMKKKKARTDDDKDGVGVGGETNLSRRQESRC